MLVLVKNNYNRKNGYKCKRSLKFVSVLTPTRLLIKYTHTALKVAYEIFFKRNFSEI